jgi:16S rRNA (uracil1498-N3)-methyltransferase
VVIGPEGGISPTEIAYAEEKGLTPVTLGERILRTETAALAVLGMIQYAVGDMG